MKEKLKIFILLNLKILLVISKFFIPYSIISR